MDILMSEFLPERLAQLNNKVLNRNIEPSELKEYKSLLELANAAMKAHEMKNNKSERLNGQ
jgi:hypothetical protein